MEQNPIVKATACEILSFGIRFKYRNEIVLVKTPELSWYPGKLEAEETIQLAQEVCVLILDKFEGEYIGSVKRANPDEDPWLSPPKLGELFDGKIVAVTEYGYFVRFKKNLLGLLRTDNLRITYKLNEKLTVQVLAVDLEKRRVYLSS